MGIIGPNLTSKHTSAYLIMLLASYKRGHDASGSLAVYEQGSGFSTIHKVTDCVDFLADFLEKPKDKTYQHFWHPETCIFMGHVRSATKGDKDKLDNVHPFVFDNIIGSHNGTIHGVFPNSTKFDVDSQALFYNLNKNKGNIQQTLKELENTFSAAYVLTWFNQLNNTFHLLRNDKRPLWLGVHKDFILYASEEDPIKLAQTWLNFKNITIKELPEDTHLTFDLTKKNFIQHIQEETIKLEYKKIVHKGYSQNRKSEIPWKNQKLLEHNPYEQINNKKQLWPLTLQQDHSKTYSRYTIGRAKNLVVYKTQAIRLLNKGCNWCQKPTPILDIDNIEWINNEEFLCPKCKNDVDVQTVLQGIY